MKSLLSLVVLTLLASCSTSPFKEATKEQEMINQHLSQGAKYLEGEFDDRFFKAGREGAYLKAVGTAIYPIETNEKVIQSAAISDSKFRLTSSAPSEFKREVQQAIGTEIGGVGDYSEISISVTEVKNLKGIKSKYEDVQCRTKVSPTGNGEYKTERECRAISKVKASELRKAYDYTISSKYGVSRNEVGKRLNRQLSSTR
jgi:hypothetical protein